MKPRATFTPAIADRILTGLSRGAGLRALCRGPDMPTRPTVMRWLNTHPEFATMAAYARQLGGLTGPGRPSGHTADLVDHIYDRLCAGEPLRSICRDVALPSRSTIHTWTHCHPTTAAAIALAQDIAAWAQAEARWLAWGGAAHLETGPSSHRGTLR